MNELAVSLSVILFHLTPATFLFIALLVARSSQKSLYARIWVVFCVLTAIAWTGAILAAFYIPGLALASLVSRIAICFGALTTLAYYAFLLAFLKLLQAHRWRLRLVAGYTFTLLVFFLNSNLFHQGVERNLRGLYQPKPGPMMPLYALMVLYVFGAAIYYSYKAFRHASGQKRLQMRYFFLGNIIVSMAAIGSLLPFTGSNSFWVWIPSALTLSFPTLLTYVVVRHRLWDIRTALHKTMFWAVVSGGTIVPVYYLLTFILQRFKENQTTPLLAITIALYVALVLLTRKVQPWVDGLFSRRHYTQRQVIDTFVTELRHLQTTHDLAKSLNETLRSKMNISEARILITNAAGYSLYDAMNSQSPGSHLVFQSQELDAVQEDNKTEDSESQNQAPASGKHTSTKASSTKASSTPTWLRSWLIQQDCAIDTAYLETTNLPALKKAEVQAFLDRRGAVIMLPLLHNNTLLGLIELGEKNNLKPYSRGDFALLERIRSATEVAMHNARLYQDLENATENLRMLTASLEQRVQRRTQDLEKAVKELEQAYEKLRKLNQVQSRFFTNITHELRTPLTLILAPLEDQLMQEHALPSALKPTLQLMHRQAIRLYSLINDLLDFARLDAKELRLKLKEFSFDTHLRSIASSFEALARRNDIELSVEIADDLPLLCGDAEKLDRVLINLLGNAFKFTPRGGKVTIRLYETEQELVCEVEDTGIGIPKDQQEHIFDRFAQVQDGDDRAFEGTGLGLALVRELIHCHQGSIEVESEPNVGSLFRVHLRKGRSHFPDHALERRKADIPTTMTRRASDRDPLSSLSLPSEVVAARSATERPPLDTPASLSVLQAVPEPTTTQPPVSSSMLSQAASTSQENDDHEPVGTRLYSSSVEPALGDLETAMDTQATLLVVEDNTDMRRYLQSILQPYYQLLVAANGKEALAVLQRSHPDLIVSDVMMPHMSGYELCRQIKSQVETAGIPVILLTANKGTDRTVEGFQSGADDYLTKPFNSRELLARIKVQLKLKQMSQQLALQEKVSLMGLLSAGLAHEVKNPANAVINAIAPLRLLTQSILGEDQDDIVELLDTVYESATRIATLCEDLLGLATTETEGVFPWDLERALEITLRILKPRYPDPIHVERDFQHTETPEGYRSQLNQVLLNLMSNAMRAVDLNGHIWVSTTSDEKMFYMTIRDNGTGIDPKILNRIFDPLFTTADVGEGTGLGLYLIKRIIANHGGTIRVESELGEGTTCFVEFPLKPMDTMSPLTPLSKSIAPALAVDSLPLT